MSTYANRRASMSWAQCLKRVFNIDIETCRACIENPVVIPKHFVGQAFEKILTHLNEKAPFSEAFPLRESRVPPPVCVHRAGRQTSLFEAKQANHRAGVTEFRRISSR